MPNGVHGASKRFGVARSDRLNPHHLYNIEASEVICKLKPVEGTHNDIAHTELARLGITAAQV